MLPAANYTEHGLTLLLTEQLDNLKHAYAEMDRKRNAACESQGNAKFGVFKMSCGGIEDFFTGLGSRIGTPCLSFKHAMKAEHCHRKDSRKLFTTKNYGISTCSYNEWYIVEAGDTDTADMRSGRRVPSIQELLELPVAQNANLSREEVMALILYTGPMFERYNCVLRRWPEKTYQEMVAEGDAFTTTIHVLVSAVQKLASVAKIPDGLKLYRGLSGVANLPENFFRPHMNGGRGFTEWGFMSTTSDKNCALQYSTMGEHQLLPMVLEFTASAIDRGACIKDFSQYPQEVEYLWLPCSFVAPDGTERMEFTPHGVVRIVPVRVNSNFTTPTLEQMVASKKLMHIAAFQYLLQELQRDLFSIIQEHGDDRLEKDFYRQFRGKHFTCEGLLQNIMGQCQLRLKAHKEVEVNRFADDNTFRRLVTEMLDVKTMAKSKLNLWLKDPSQCIMSLEIVSLHDAHRKFLGLLTKNMQLEKHEAKKQTALELCRLKGLVVTSVDEIDDVEQGETKLESAAADGVSTSDLQLMIKAAGLIGNSDKYEAILAEALMKSATFGHENGIKLLVETKVDINFKDKDGSTPLSLAAKNCQVNAVATLLESKANVNGTDTNGASSLYLAARDGHTEVMKLLLDAKADANMSKDGFAPISIAAQNGHTDAVKLLCEYYGDVSSLSQSKVPKNCFVSNPCMHSFVCYPCSVLT